MLTKVIVGGVSTPITGAKLDTLPHLYWQPKLICRELWCLPPQYEELNAGSAIVRAKRINGSTLHPSSMSAKAGKRVYLLKFCSELRRPESQGLLDLG